LLKPEFKGENPDGQSQFVGHAYVAIATLVQLMGEEKAFDYLKKLHANINAYTRSGTAPMKAVAAARRRSASVSCMTASPRRWQAFRSRPRRRARARVYEIGSMSIVKGARNLANAKKFYDWALQSEAHKLEAQAKQFQVPSNKATPVPPEAPKFADIQADRLRPGRYGKSAERKRLIARWDAEVGALAKP